MRNLWQSLVAALQMVLFPRIYRFETNPIVIEGGRTAVAIVAQGVGVLRCDGYWTFVAGRFSQRLLVPLAFGYAELRFYGIARIARRRIALRATHEVWPPSIPVVQLGLPSLEPGVVRHAVSIRAAALDEVRHHVRITNDLEQLTCRVGVDVPRVKLELLKAK